MTTLPLDLNTREHGKFGQAGHVQIGGLEKTVKLAYDGSNNLQYVGIADIGSASAAAVWQIRKLLYDGSNNLTDVQWAATTVGTGPTLALYNKIWDNRASLTYS